MHKNFKAFPLSDTNSTKLIQKNKYKRKRSISARINPDLIYDIDKILPFTKFRNRTEFMEHASQEFYRFIVDLINDSEFETT